MLYRLIIFVLLTALLAPAQITQRSKPIPRNRSVKAKSNMELSRLVASLRAQGARIALTNEKVSQPFFSRAGRVMTVNGEGVQVFEYSHALAADKEAKLVSSDGMRIGTTKPSWMAPPHFFQSGRLIVLYVGNEQTIVRILEGAIGRQFAGIE